MESAAPAGTGGTRRGRKSAEGELHAATAGLSEQQVVVTKVSGYDDESGTTTKRYVSRQRTPARRSDFVYDFEPDTHAEVRTSKVHDDMADTPRRKRGRPRKFEPATLPVARKRGRLHKDLDASLDPGSDAHLHVQVLSHEEAADNPETRDDVENFQDDELTETEDEPETRRVSESRTRVSRGGGGRQASDGWNQVSSMCFSAF